jgi:hypothetical protein
MALHYLTTTEQSVIADALNQYESHLESLLKEKHPEQKAIEDTIGMARLVRFYAQNRNNSFLITTP